MRNKNWSTLVLGKAENEAWFYSIVTVSLSIDAKHTI